MNKRLAQFIEYKTGGNQKEFADLLGWSPQYLHKLLKGDSMGIQPVISLLQTFPDMNARWLILGEGSMVDVASEAVRRMLNLYKYEEYIPVMGREQIDAVMAGQTFDSATVSEWAALIKKRKNDIQRRFDMAYRKQEKPANSLQVETNQSTNN